MLPAWRGGTVPPFTPYKTTLCHAYDFCKTPRLLIYLRNKFSGTALPPALPAIIHGRTEGNPLFMVVMIEQLLREGAIEQTHGQWRIKEDVTALAARIPEGLRPLIRQEFDNLQKEEQRLLEIASVVGTEFGAAAIAPVLEQSVEAVEELCHKLASRCQFVSESGVEEWPDGTIGGRYRFLHVLYHEVIYDRIAEARRVQWHRRIAERKAEASLCSLGSMGEKTESSARKAIGNNPFVLSAGAERRSRRMLGTGHALSAAAALQECQVSSVKFPIPYTLHLNNHDIVHSSMLTTSCTVLGR
jgi:hypothetical protein